MPKQAATGAHGFGTGSSYLMLTGTAVHPETRLWYQGRTSRGHQIKTVAVLKFESLSGEPIAAYVNYAIHALTITRWHFDRGFPRCHIPIVERAYDDKMVAIWTMAQLEIKIRSTCAPNTMARSEVYIC